MERVQYSLERSLPQLKQLDEHAILSKEEIRSVTSQRQAFEARLIRRKAEKTDFVRYLEFEDDLHELVVLRARERTRRVSEMVKAGDESAKSQHLPRAFLPKQAAQHSAQCVSIYERLVRKFRWDVDVWERYLRWAKSRKMRVVIGRVYARALALHPSHPELWISAADYELNSNADTTAARALLQRGLRMNKLVDAGAVAASAAQQHGKKRKMHQGASASRDPGALRWSLTPYEKDVLRLWMAYLRMELVFLERLRRRWRVLGLDGGAAPLPLRGTSAAEADQAAQSVDLGTEDAPEDEEVAAAEAAVDADVPSYDDEAPVDADEAPGQRGSSAPASAGVRPAAGVEVPAGHQHIMSGAIPLVVMAHARQSVPPSVQVFLFTAMWQLVCSFPLHDAVALKPRGEVQNLRADTGVVGSGDQLRARLLQGLMDEWRLASDAWSAAGQLTLPMLEGLHALLHPLSHSVRDQLSWAALPASQHASEIESHAYLHGASQLPPQHAAELDGLYAVAQLPGELEKDVARGAGDTWAVGRAVLFLLELVKERMVVPATAPVDEEEEEEEVAAELGVADHVDADAEARSVSDATAASSSVAVSWAPTPYLAMLASSGDLPLAVQAVVAAFRASGHADMPLAFLMTLRQLQNPLRSGIDEENLLTYLASVDAKLVATLQAHVTWLDVLSTAQSLPDSGADAWAAVQALWAADAHNPCVCLLYERAALRLETEAGFAFSWAAASDEHAGDRACQAWKPLLDACTTATQLAHDTAAPAWGLLAVWLHTSSWEQAPWVAPAAARRALWTDYLDWVHDAALVSESPARVTSEARRASRWAWQQYEAAVVHTGRLLGASHLIGAARENAQALHDAVVRRFCLFSSSSSALPAVSKKAAPERAARERALAYVMQQSSASTACWLEIARLESMRMEAQPAAAADLAAPTARLFARAAEQAEREEDVAQTIDAWLAYLAHLVQVQRDMPLALQTLATATTRVRALGGADAVVRLEAAWAEGL